MRACGALSRLPVPYIRKIEENGRNFFLYALYLAADENILSSLFWVRLRFLRDVLVRTVRFWTVPPLFVDQDG